MQRILYNMIDQTESGIEEPTGRKLNDKHEFGIRDREFLQKGLAGILNFVLMYVRKN